MLDLIYNLSKVSDRSEYAELAEKYRDGIQYLNKQPLEIRPVEYSRGNYSYRVNRRG